MNHDRYHRTALLTCAWCGSVLTVLFFVGFVPLANLIPPQHPTDSGREIAAVLVDHTDGIRAGMLLP